jgi:hypothetical protein
MACGSIAAAAAALLAAALPLSVDAAELPSIDVDGTEFKVTLTDGRMLRSAELVGATLTIGTSGGRMRLRIDTVERDRETRHAPVWLHSFSTAAEDGSWRPLCDRGPDGRRQGFPLAGRGHADGTIEPAEPGIFEIVCTSGARGKCVLFGYLPWVSAAMRNIYNACAHGIRADYCGTAYGSTSTTTAASSSRTSIQRMNSRQAGPKRARFACIMCGSKRISRSRDWPLPARDCATASARLAQRNALAPSARSCSSAPCRKGRADVGSGSALPERLCR